MEGLVWGGFIIVLLTDIWIIITFKQQHGWEGKLWGSEGLTATGLTPARTHRHYPDKSQIQKSPDQCGWAGPWGAMENPGPTAANPSGETQRLQHPWNLNGDLRRLQSKWQRVFLWQASWCLFLHFKLLPDWQATHDGRDVRSVFWPGAWLLGHRWDLSGVMLPGTVPSEEGADEWRAKKRGWNSQGEGRRSGGHGLLSRQKAEALGFAGETELFCGGQGRASTWSTHAQYQISEYSHTKWSHYDIST